MEEKLLRDLCWVPPEGEDDSDQKLQAAQGAGKLAWDLPEGPESGKDQGRRRSRKERLVSLSLCARSSPLSPCSHLISIRPWSEQGGRSWSSRSAC